MDENNDFRPDNASAPESGPNAPYSAGSPVYDDDEDYPGVDPESSGFTPPPYSEPGKKDRKGMSAGGAVLLALICALVGICLGAAGILFFTRSTKTVEETPAPSVVVTPAPTEEPVEATQAPSRVQPETPAEDTVTEDGRRAMSESEVYAANVNSTVGIRVGITTNYWGYQTTAAASGSGFIFSEDGYILTNYHVIEDASTITVTTFDDNSYNATVVGYDTNLDIAVLKIDAEGLTPVVLGSSEDLVVGEKVVAIGNPLGELTFSLTHGIVSALDRQITLSSGVTMTLIQTDTSINSGNSGGPLFNMYGEVVGITNAKYSASSSSGRATIDNIGFAIPIDQVKGTVESIIEYGYIVKPYIGVSVATVTADLQSYGIPKGVAVKAITPDSPAEASDLQINDVITAINGTEVSTSGELVKIVGETTPGDEIVLTVYRQRETEPLSITITVGSQQQEAMEPPEAQPEKGDGYYYEFPFGFGSFG